MNGWKYILFMGTIFLQGEEFVTATLQGQLGNQMFQIAAATAISLEHGVKAVFPDLQSQMGWNIPLNREKIFFCLDDSLPKEAIEYTYREPFFHYQEIPYRKNMKITGYFQSEKYFRKHKECIVSLFAPSEEVCSYLREKYRWIIEDPKTVSIHFREYRWEDPGQGCHPNCTMLYYRSAIERFPEDSLFVVFSNNIAWCKENFSDIPRDFFFVEGEHFHHDFYLMSMCKSHIISNSSFSWWAAYLNQNPGKVVIAPKLWFGENYIRDTFDIVPSDWIVLPTK